ncbi:MAG: heparinase II/III family protein [Lachnospiraceae bacterium]|nr:heparinase II/III family protein [Lachnospiraceae bacterium]
MMLKSILNEYGLAWAFNRELYSLKLKTLSLFPFTERLYEHENTDVLRLDIFDIKTDSLLTYLQGLDDREKTQIIECADNAVEGKIEGFSSIILDYGCDIAWQLNPLTGKATDEKNKWFKIPDFDKERGDIKVIWEISRFSHLVTLARAYYITNQIKYYNAFSSQIDSWVEHNPYSYGANYKCGQECSIRMVNLLLAYSAFNNMGILTENDISNIKTIVSDSYKKVLSNFFYAYKCIKNNHTISELMGMIIGAWCCNDEKTLKKAFKYINKVIQNQFFEDGGYSQFSFNYQRLALMALNILLSTQSKTKLTFTEKNIDRILKSALMLYECQTDKFDVPNYGANDGALIFKLTSCGYRDFRAVVNTTYKLIRGKELYENDIHREELIWLGINIDNLVFDVIERKSSKFPKAGIFTLRSNENFFMTICNDYKGRPGHMDQMHIDFWIGDVNVFCDGGTYSYASETGQKMLKASGHNTLIVQDCEQMAIRPPFFIYNWPNRQNYIFSQNNICVSSKFKTGYEHMREIVKSENGFNIIDIIGKDDNNDYCIVFNTCCDVELQDNRVKLSWQGKVLCYMDSQGTCTVEKTERSLYYLKKDVINRISVKSNKAEIITKIILED